MDPFTIIVLAIQTLQEAFKFGTQLLIFLATEQGKKLVDLYLNDRKKWDDFWNPLLAGARENLQKAWDALVSLGKQPQKQGTK